MPPHFHGKCAILPKCGAKICMFQEESSYNKHGKFKIFQLFNIGQLELVKINYYFVLKKIKIISSQFLTQSISYK